MRAVAERAAAVVVIPAVESVAHACSVITPPVTEVAAMVPRAVAVAAPAVVSAVHGVEVGRAEVEVVASRIAGVHAEVPTAGVPGERTVEIGGVAVHAVLPVVQDVAQVQVAALPVEAVQVVVVVDAHQVVEVDFVCGLILVIGEVELVSHLVCQEKGLMAGLLVTHGVGRGREREQ